jgi:hypothetical protein
MEPKTVVASFVDRHHTDWLASPIQTLLRGLDQRDSSAQIAAVNLVTADRAAQFRRI